MTAALGGYFVSPLIARPRRVAMKKIRFTEASIARLKSKGTRYLVRNANLAGHYLRIYPTGNKTHYALTRDPSGTQVWQPVGDASLLTPEEAEEQARIALRAIKSGND